MRSVCLGVGALGLVAAAPAAGRPLINWGTLGFGNAPSVTVNNVTVTGSANVNFAGPSLPFTTNGGLGIVGGGNDLSLDPGETITIDYVDSVFNVRVSITDIDPPGNVNYSFEAFNGGTSLGVFAVAPQIVSPEWINLSAISGLASFTRVTFMIDSTPALLGLIFEQTEYEIVPAPAGALGILLACGGLVARRRRGIRGAR